MNIGRALLLMLVIAVASCGGGSPTQESATLNLTGTWTGTWTFTSGGATVSDNVTVVLNQNGSTAGGLWNASSAAGTFSFTAAADFTGSASISQTLIIGGNCSANTTVTGTATNSQIRITLGTLTPTALCQWPASNQFLLTK
jgi:hypothetical protein